MLNNGFTNLMIVAGIALGSIIGHISPEKGSMIGNYVDYLVFLLVMLLFFEMKVLISKNIVEQVRFLSIVWITNFLIVPLIGYFISMFFFGDKPAIYIGLIIYFMAPCTNWFLGFTKIAGGGGNTSLGATFFIFRLDVLLSSFETCYTIRG